MRGVEFSAYIHIWLNVLALTQDRLALAARARLGRFMAPKKKQKHLEAPEAVRQHWEGGNKKEMSELFRVLNFDRVFWQQFKSMAV